MGCLTRERIEEAKRQLKEIYSDKALSRIIIDEQMHELEINLMKKKAWQAGAEATAKKAERKAEKKIIRLKKENAEKIRNTAKKLKIMGIPLDKIKEATNLEMEEIKSL